MPRPKAPDPKSSLFQNGGAKPLQRWQVVNFLSRKEGFGAPCSEKSESRRMPSN